MPLLLLLQLLQLVPPPRPLLVPELAPDSIIQLSLPTWTLLSLRYLRSLFYSLSHVLRAHRQAITVMELTGSQVITGSLDHTVKVHALSLNVGYTNCGVLPYT